MRWTSAAVLGAVLPAAVLWQVRGAAALDVDWLQQHPWALSIGAGLWSWLAVTRRRSAHREHAPRSWLGALPIRPMVRLGEACILQLASVGAVLGVLTLLGASAALCFAAGGLPVHGVYAVWREVAGGAVCGAAGGFLLPLATPEMPAPGSRYVPPSAAQGRGALRPSLNALASWPIRALFARIQPKTVSRGLLPVLLSMGIGTSAADAMVVIVALATALTLLLLVAALLAVTRAARLWLQPLPIAMSRLAQVIAPRPWALMGALCVVLGWLLWVQGQPPVTALGVALTLLLFASLIAAAGMGMILRPRS